MVVYLFRDLLKNNSWLPGRVAVELKAERPKFSHDLAVAKASKASQSIHAATTMV